VYRPIGTNEKTNAPCSLVTVFCTALVPTFRSVMATPGSTAFCWE